MISTVISEWGLILFIRVVTHNFKKNEVPVNLAILSRRNIFTSINITDIISIELRGNRVTVRGNHAW